MAKLSDPAYRSARTDQLESEIARRMADAGAAALDATSAELGPELSASLSFWSSESEPGGFVGRIGGHNNPYKVDPPIARKTRPRRRPARALSPEAIGASTAPSLASDAPPEAHLATPIVRVDDWLAKKRKDSLDLRDALVPSVPLAPVVDVKKPLPAARAGASVASSAGSLASTSRRPDKGNVSAGQRPGRSLQEAIDHMQTHDPILKFYRPPVLDL